MFFTPFLKPLYFPGLPYDLSESSQESWQSSHISRERQQASLAGKSSRLRHEICRNREDHEDNNAPQSF